MSASASASALTIVGILENGYDADTWCGLYRYRLMRPITSVNADDDSDAWFNQGLKSPCHCVFSSQCRKAQVMFEKKLSIHNIFVVAKAPRNKHDCTAEPDSSGHQNRSRQAMERHYRPQR